MYNWLDRTSSGEMQGDEKKLFQKARQALWDYEPLRASHAEVGIEVRGRSIRLTGRVRTLPQKTMAGLLVQRLREVEAVSNDIVADGELAREVANALAEDPLTRPLVLGVEVRHGVVNLRGEVPNAEVRRRALAIVSRVDDVADVRDLLVEHPDAEARLATSRASDPRTAIAN